MLTRPNVAAPTTSPTAWINQNLAAAVDGEALLAEQDAQAVQDGLPIVPLQEPEQLDHPIFGRVRPTGEVVEMIQKVTAVARHSEAIQGGRDAGMKTKEEVEAEARRAARRTRWSISAKSSTVASVGLFAGAVWLGYGGGV